MPVKAHGFNSLPRTKKGEVYPRYDLVQIEQLRKSIHKTLTDKYGGFNLSGDAFDIFVGDVRETLPSTVRPQALYDSLTYLAGEPLTKQIIGRLAYRLAGNLPRLVRGLPVIPWTFQQYVEWCPAQIVAMRLHKSATGKLGYILSFRLLAGTAAGLIVQRFWSKKFCYVVAPSLGFSKKRRRADQIGYLPRTMHHVKELVTLQALVRLDPTLCKGEPLFEKISVPANLLKWNKEQMKHRDRMDKGYDCPKGYTLSQVMCHQCPVGFTTCRAACHRTQYVFQLCTECGRRAAFDKELTAEMCLDCFEMAVLEKGRT